MGGTIVTGLIRLRHNGLGARTVGAVLSVAVIAASCLLGPSAAFGEEPLPSPTPTVIETPGPATPGPETPAPDATAAPEVPPTPEPTAPVVDTPPEGTPVIGLSGTLFVAVSEGNPDTSLDSLSADAGGSETTYAVQTDDGVFVQIEDDVPADAASGDQFEGTVALPAEVIDAIPNADAAEITNSADPLPADSDAAVVAQAAASDLGAVLATSAVTISPALTLPSNTVSHKLYIAVVNPRGSSAEYYTNTDVATLTSYVSDYWRTQSEGDIPAFTTNATIVRYTSAFSCDASVSPGQRWTEAEARFFSAPGKPDNTGDHLAVLLPASCEAGAGIGWHGWIARVDHEIKGSNGGRYGFQTPLTNQYAFNGNALQFFDTPKEGLRDTWTSVRWEQGPWSALGEYHWFHGDSDGRRFGRELDLNLTYTVNPRAYLRAQWARYVAAPNGFGVDTDKVWLTFGYQIK